MNKNFSQKRKTMELLDKIQKEFNSDSKVIIKNNIQESNTNDNTKNELKLSFIIEEDNNKDNKDNNDNNNNDNDQLDNHKNTNKNIEISIVNPKKIEEKQKNIESINNFINLCENDIKRINKTINRIKYSTNSLIVESTIVNEKSIMVIDKVNENNEASKGDQNVEERINYLLTLKDKFTSLKDKLTNLLSFYKSEKEITEEKKKNIEELELLKIKYDELKQKNK